MAQFILLDFDYEPYIGSEEQAQKFARMQQLIKHFHKPIAQCWQQVEEFENLHRQIIGVGKQIKIEPLKGSEVSVRPDLN